MGRRGHEVGILDSQSVAFVFPGQGSQEVGMGRDLAESFPQAADIFKRADEALGFALSGLCFNGPEDQLKQTINTQPALFATSAAVCEVLFERGVRPCCAAGHSVGEYAALYAAGAFSFEDGLRLVRTRAELMQKAGAENPGTMAAILGLSPDQVSEVVAKAAGAGVVAAANFNSPIQTVISGEVNAVQRASEIAQEMGAKRVVPLAVSGAFHSPLMQSAADSLVEALAAADMRDLGVPVVANYTADFEKTADQVRANLASQITGSVRWTQSVTKMVEAGAEVFVELGPGSVLAGLIKRIAPEAQVYSVGDRASLEAVLNSE
jgi:[acyl-carrier-protein] S-malonyltransferase